MATDAVDRLSRSAARMCIGAPLPESALTSPFPDLSPKLPVLPVHLFRRLISI
jgi:hypothetical protein